MTICITTALLSLRAKVKYTENILNNFTLLLVYSLIDLLSLFLQFWSNSKHWNVELLGKSMRKRKNHTKKKQSCIYRGRSTIDRTKTWIIMYSSWNHYNKLLYIDERSHLCVLFLTGIKLYFVVEYNWKTIFII